MAFAKKRWTYIITALVALMIGSSSGPSAAELTTLENKNDKLSKEVTELNSTNKALEDKVAEAAPYFEMAEEERKIKEAEAKAKAEELKKKEEAAKAKKEAEEKAAQAKQEAEEKAAAEAAAKKAEEEAKKGYDTGITYDQLARNPDDYMLEKIKFSGKVVQVMEGDGFTQIRLAVKGDYDTILYGEFTADTVESRILEDDNITVMGLSSGLITYESTIGGKISIPGIMIEKIEQ